MAVDLSEFVEVLRREVTPPGSTEFANVSDDVFLGYLADGFWEAVLDKIIVGYTCDVDGFVRPVSPGTPQFGRDQVALCVLYAGLKILRNQLAAKGTRFSAKAGPVEYTTETGSNVITSMLKQLQDVRNRLLAMSTFGDSQVYVLDAFSGRSVSPSSYHGHLMTVFGDLLAP